MILRLAFMKTAEDTGYFIRFDLGSLIAYAGAGSVTANAEFRVTDGPDNNFPTGELVARKAKEAVDGRRPDADPPVPVG